MRKIDNCSCDIRRFQPCQLSAQVDRQIHIIQQRAEVAGTNLLQRLLRVSTWSAYQTASKAPASLHPLHSNSSVACGSDGRPDQQAHAKKLMWHLLSAQ